MTISRRAEGLLIARQPLELKGSVKVASSAVGTQTLSHIPELRNLLSSLSKVPEAIAYLGKLAKTLKTPHLMIAATIMPRSIEITSREPKTRPKQC